MKIKAFSEVEVSRSTQGPRLAQMPDTARFPEFTGPSMLCHEPTAIPSAQELEPHITLLNQTGILIKKGGRSGIFSF